MSLTPAEKSARARLAALARWARHDPVANGARGQAGLMRRFLAEVDAFAAANGEQLTERERTRRAECLRKAHMARLAFNRERARRARAAARRTSTGGGKPEGGTGDGS